MGDFEYEKGPVGSEDSIGEIVNMYPEAQDFLSGFGMHCFGCATAGAETLAEACRVHGLDTFKVKRELNRIITENPAWQPCTIRLKQQEIRLQTADAEVTAMMLLQRVCDVEMQMKNKSSNGPLRAQRKSWGKYSVT